MKQIRTTAVIPICLACTMTPALAAQPFDILTLSGQAEVGTAAGTSNGVYWTLSETYISNLTVEDGSFTGFGNSSHTPPIGPTDMLHIGNQDFTLRFNRLISEVRIHVGENPPSPDGTLDFGIVPEVISGNILISGTEIIPLDFAGGTVVLRNVFGSEITHASTTVGGVHFAVVVTPVGCTDADLAAPPGVLDLADINAFTTGFLAMDAIADLNLDGLFDLSDISLFVTSFIAGCP